MRISGRVIRIFDEEKIAINLGSAQGVKRGKNVAIYAPTIEIEDPSTNENLGEYRHLKDVARVISVSARFSIVGPHSKKEETVAPGSYSALGGFWGRTPTVTKTVPGHLDVNDAEAKPIPTGDEIRVGDTVEIEVDDPPAQASSEAQEAAPEAD
jgi:hypothetical protein